MSIAKKWPGDDDDDVSPPSIAHLSLTFWHRVVLVLPYSKSCPLLERER